MKKAWNDLTKLVGGWQYVVAYIVAVFPFPIIVDTSTKDAVVAYMERGNVVWIGLVFVAITAVLAHWGYRTNLKGDESAGERAQLKEFKFWMPIIASFLMYLLVLGTMEII